MIMETKHTPGPWEWDGDVTNYDKENEAPWLTNDKHGLVLIGEIVATNPFDAKLIAAAPDLLEALQTLLSDEMYQDISYPTKKIVEAAIKKATE
jgi:hypothetical protein